MNSHIRDVLNALVVCLQDGTKATMLFTTVMCHKAIVAFSVGLQLSRTHAHQLHWVVIAIVLLALMSPLGACLGTVIQVIVVF
jgi:hypothetical protein